MNKIIKIGNKNIGKAGTCFIIAEAGVNHNGSPRLAKDLIRKAAKAGADAIKFQNYDAKKLVIRTAPRFWDWEGEKKKGGSQYDSYSLLDKFPKERYGELVKCCKDNNILFMSTPFDEENADLLDGVGTKIYKIASCDITNLPFLKYVAKKKKPMILSTGASNIGEIQEALDVIYSAGNDKIALLHCTLCYPTEYKDVNLRMMKTLMNIFPDVPVGLSDHSLGIAVPSAAVALDARIIEKHYTIDKTLKVSADHWLSIDDKELKDLVDNKNKILQALGISLKQKIPCENLTFKYARRSLVANKFIPEGTRIKKEMIAIKRPGIGIGPKFYDIFVGKIAQRDIREDEMLCWRDIG